MGLISDSNTPIRAHPAYLSNTCALTNHYLPFPNQNAYETPTEGINA